MGRRPTILRGLVAPIARRAPRTLYGVYKVANEGTAAVYWQDYGLSSIALRPYTVYGLGRDQGLTSDPTHAMLAAAAGRPFHIKFGGQMQFQLASDVARQFIAAATQAADGAHVYTLGGEPASIAKVITHIEAVAPGAEITHDTDPLPFPTGFDDSLLRSAMPTVYETPLDEGIRQTIVSFRRLLQEGRLVL